MNNDFEQIKTILMGLSLVSDSQYNRLIEVYGEDVVIDVIKELYNEDNSILLKLGKFVSDLYLNLNLDEVVMDAYDYYIKDIKNVEKKSDDEKNKLLNEIVVIIGKLNMLFDKIEKVDDMDNKNNVPWLSDKMEYVLNNYKDMDLINNIKNLYNEYVNKRNIFLESYLRFVIMVAKTFRSSESGLDLEDLIQYGNMGLIRAIEMYDSSKDVEFLTYAGYWIKQSIIYNSKKVMYTIKLPVHWHEIRSKWARSIESLTQKLGRYPTMDEIALDIDMESKKLQMIIHSFQMFSSLDELIENNLDESTDECICEYDRSMIEIVADDNFSLDRNMEYSDMCSELDYYMNLYLNDREIFILKTRFGFIDEISVPELAKMYGVSEQRIYQIIQNSCVKLFKNDDFKKMKIYLR